MTIYRRTKKTQVFQQRTTVELLRGAILNTTYGTHKKPKYFAIFTNNIWSYLLWTPVVLNATISAVAPAEVP